MKKISFLGDSLERIKEFSSSARHNAGYQLDKVQRGKQPDDFKPMPTIGKGVEEIRIWDESGTYRIIYTARIDNTIYVLHAFKKKTQETPKKDIDLAKLRLNELMRSL
jgi:phage-related protein